tara:strand:+ start:104 stop:493 length:390 start_codon:yes stop_codon:yes gene_type:complete
MINVRNENIVKLEKLNNETKNMIKPWLKKSKILDKDKINSFSHSEDLQRTLLHTYARFDTILKIILDQEKRIVQLENELSRIKNTKSEEILIKKNNPNYEINTLFDNFIPKGGLEFLEAYIGESPTKHL